MWTYVLSYPLLFLFYFFPPSFYSSSPYPPNFLWGSFSRKKEKNKREKREKQKGVNLDLYFIFFLLSSPILLLLIPSIFCGDHLLEEKKKEEDSDYLAFLMVSCLSFFALGVVSRVRRFRCWPKNNKFCNSLHYQVDGLSQRGNNIYQGGLGLCREIPPYFAYPR